MIRTLIASTAAAALLVACGQGPEKAEAPANDIEQTKGPSQTTRQFQSRVKSDLNFENRRDFERAKRGFIGTFEDTVIPGPISSAPPAFDFGIYKFLENDAPDTVNPSLWRQSQLASMHGLFEVTDGIYQVRGFDLSNMTVIRGDKGWIVVDPLIAKETAARAMELVNRELGERPISAVIYTHSHIDHFGGVRGVITDEDVKNGTEIIAPANFTDEAVSENVLAGNGMARRASYMFGGLLQKSPKQQVGTGLGQTVSSGTPGLMTPTIEVNRTGQTVTVDGVKMEFIMALDAEAPSEFMFYLPQFKAFCQAEIINHTLHNLYTPRGAKVRNGRKWSVYIDEAIYTYGEKTEVSFGSHHWPVWGRNDVNQLWENQRDLYRYIHDQTLRHANMGNTMHEIPELLDMPAAIAKPFENRSYYGTVSHNAKSQYQLYFGYFDGNPAHLDPLNPVEESKKYLEYMGGARAVIDRARKDFESGEYRFAATALNHVVFSEPSNQGAADLLAQTYDQLAYMAESGSWRNFYLTAASELRNGVLDLPAPRTSGPDMVRALGLSDFLDLLAVRLNGPKAANKTGTEEWRFNFEISDTGEKAVLILSNGVLHHRMGQADKDADASVTFTRAGFDQLNLKQKTVAELRKDGAMQMDGNLLKFRSFFGFIEEPEFWFEIVRP